MIEHTTMNHRLTVRTKPNADNLKTKNKENPKKIPHILLPKITTK